MVKMFLYDLETEIQFFATMRKNDLEKSLLIEPKRPERPFPNAALCENMSRSQALINAEWGI